MEVDGRLSRSFLLSLCPTHFQTPHLFGLLKVHKPGVPLRPIVSQINCLFSQLSRYLSNVLKPLMMNSKSYVLNSQDLKDKLLSDSCIMDGSLISFDVESLFSNVPVDGALDAFRRVLSSDDSFSIRSIFTINEFLELF